MVRLHIRGADANYRRLRHLRAAAALCVVIVFSCIIKPTSIPEIRKEGPGCVTMMWMMMMMMLVMMVVRGCAGTQANNI